MTDTNRLPDGAIAGQTEKEAKQLKGLAEQQGIEPSFEVLARAAIECAMLGHWHKAAGTLTAAPPGAPAEPLPLNQLPAFQPASYGGPGLPHPAENSGSGYPRMLGPDDIEPPPDDDDDEPKAPKSCRHCGIGEKPGTALIPVGDTSRETRSEWIHASCMHDEYCFCRVCASRSNVIAWHVVDLNEADECPIHAGEFGLPSEDEDDWDHLAENLRNNN